MTKYSNKPLTIDGIRFASKREGHRYANLKLMQEANEIEALELQPSFKIEINGMTICRYRADFTYKCRRTGETIIEDTKGYRTPVYKLKRKLMKACHGIEVLET